MTCDGLLHDLSLKSDDLPATIVRLCPLRGAEVQLLSPQGVVKDDVAFTWASGIAAAQYRVEIGSGDRSLFSTNVARGPLPMPAALAQIVKPGVEYWWTVTALDRGGAAIVSSPRQTFTIAGDRP